MHFKGIFGKLIQFHDALVLKKYSMTSSDNTINWKLRRVANLALTLLIWDETTDYRWVTHMKKCHAEWRQVLIWIEHITTLKKCTGSPLYMVSIAEKIGLYVSSV